MDGAAPRQRETRVAQRVQSLGRGVLTDGARPPFHGSENGLAAGGVGLVVEVGGKAVVDAVFERNHRFFGPRRKDGARQMRFADWGGLRAARALRVAPVHAPLTT